ncbi:DNA (cytosine-5-)-methyltransferase [Pandoraea capi]|uniref:Cytosine-specific methyltransferase n=1 Tax=Pandoraea capi TaxID=2508286 RepID=A0ABY6WCK9_9BURK|nr:DNA cytosine methyltransferase [Pandoraea capi]VVE56437.1 DNA (cytosine-5-)-methyltransferase [Pandoraea capi]
MTSLKKNNRPVGIDLFAGAGGLSLGFEQAGFDIAAAVEIDPVHSATHEYNFPGCTTICGSVVDLTGAEIRERAKLGAREIDVVFGGAPCQGFSMIGKRALDDPRNQLVFHYVRLVKELQPKYCVFENVKGLTLGAHSKFLGELIEALGEAGYDVLLPYKVLNAADFSVPQDRRRLFLVGTRKGLNSPQYPEPTGRVTVGEAIGDLPDADEFDELKVQDFVATTWKTKSAYARRLRGLDSDPEDYGYQRKFDASVLTSSMRTEHTDLSKSRFMATEGGKTEPVSRFRKLDEKGLCNTLRAGTDSARGAFTSPRPIHPSRPRVITVREAARLHSYPDWFRFHVTKWHGFRQIGNSVPPHLARAVGLELMAAMGKTPTKPTEVIVRQNPSLLEMDMSAAAKHFGVKSTVIAQRLRKAAKPEDGKKSTNAEETYATEEC